MNTMNLNNGVQIPALGYGVFQTPPEETVAAVRTALDVGYRHIDTAMAYGNEREVGEALRRFLTEKLLADDNVRAIGVSNFMPEHLARLLEETTVVPAVNQIEVHPYFRQPEVLAANAAHGIVSQAWSPIGGITFYRDGSHGSTLEDPAIRAIAEAHGRTPAQVMLRWHLQQGRQAIPKSVTPSRIAENLDVFGFVLDDDQLAAIDALDTGVRGGPDPESITREAYGRAIPEA